MVEEQLELLEVKQSYSLVNLKDICFEEIKKQYPKALEEEEQEEYLDFIHDEAMLLFAERMRGLAQEIEDRIYNKQKEDIKILYSKWSCIISLFIL